MNPSINQRKTLAILASKIKNLCESDLDSTLSPIELELMKKQIVELYDTLLHFNLSETKLSLESPKEAIETVLAPTEIKQPEAIAPAENEEVVEAPEPIVPDEKPVEQPIAKEVFKQRPIQFELLVDQEEAESTESKIEETAIPEPSSEPETEAIETVNVIEEELVEEVNEIENQIPSENGAEENQANEIERLEESTTDEADSGFSTIDESDLAGKFGNAPIHDLKKEISIAKKFEFINSLFNGNVEKYAYAIHYINNLKNGDEAFAYLWELKAENDWDEEDDNFLELANMVRRRYKS